MTAAQVRAKQIRELAAIGGVYSYRAIILDQKPPGTNGGSAIGGQWQKRDLNLIANNPGGIVNNLANNQFALTAGIYYVRASAPGANIEHHQIRLIDVSNAVVLYGTSEYAPSSVQTRSWIDAPLLALPNNLFELQHRSIQNQTAWGLGAANNFGGEELYSIINLELVTPSE